MRSYAMSVPNGGGFKKVIIIDNIKVRCYVNRDEQERPATTRREQALTEEWSKETQRERAGAIEGERYGLCHHRPNVEVCM